MVEQKLLQHWDDRGQLPADKKVWLQHIRERLQKLDASRKYRDGYVLKIIDWSGMNVGTPSRKTSMTLAQEKLGWELSMRSFDRAIWLAGVGMAEDLKGQVALPEQFILHRTTCALVFTDQIPVWVKIGRRKMTCAEHESASSSKDAMRLAGGATRGQRVSHAWSQSSQKLRVVLMDHTEKAAAEGMTQRRSGSSGSGEDEKFRVTLEARQAVLHFFDPLQTPVGVHLPPLLIAYGVHCRLSNISKDRRWIADEELEVAGVMVVRKKGEKVPGGLMEGWLAARDAHPKMFADIVVMQ